MEVAQTSEVDYQIYGECTILFKIPNSRTKSFTIGSGRYNIKKTAPDLDRFFAGRGEKTHTHGNKCYKCFKLVIDYYIPLETYVKSRCNIASNSGLYALFEEALIKVNKKPKDVKLYNALSTIISYISEERNSAFHGKNDYESTFKLANPLMFKDFCSLSYHLMRHIFNDLDLDLEGQKLYDIKITFLS